jgi:HAD superfamily phosphatase (TIGR01668 family)
MAEGQRGQSMKLIQPDLVVDCLSDLDIPYWYARGVRGIFMDLDNTIAPWRRNDITDEARELIAKAREAGVTVVLLTNAGERRVREAAWSLGVGYYAFAKKPFSAMYRKAMSDLELTGQSVMAVGDQLFTDVLGGNLAGCTTVLIAPLDVREHAGTKFLRFLERLAGRKTAFRGTAPKQAQPPQ